MDLNKVAASALILVALAAVSCSETKDVVDSTKDAASTVVDKTKDVVSEVADVATDAVDATVDAATDAVDATIDAASDAAASFEATGEYADRVDEFVITTADECEAAAGSIIDLGAGNICFIAIRQGDLRAPAYDVGQIGVLNCTGEVIIDEDKGTADCKIKL